MGGEMNIKKICPLMTIHGMGKADCPEEKCAWWLKSPPYWDEGCAITILAWILQGSAEESEGRLKDIARELREV